jgi:hypothetical protein
VFSYLVIRVRGPTSRTTIMADSSVDRSSSNAIGGLFDIDEDADPDLAWIIDAASTSAAGTGTTAAAKSSSSLPSTKTGNHPDDEEEIEFVSSSETTNDAQSIHVGTSIAKKTSTNRYINASQPQRSRSIPKLKTDRANSSTTASSKVISTSPVKRATSSSYLPPRYQRDQKNVVKVNGEDTILNLYAATVAKAVSPTRKQTPQAATVSRSEGSTLQPTTKSTTIPRSSMKIRPEISKPKKTTSAIANSPSTFVNKVISQPTSPTKSNAVQATSSSSAVNVSSSPLTQVTSMAVGTTNARMPRRTEIEPSDHDEDDAIFETFTSQLDQKQNAAGIASTNSQALKNNNDLTSNPYKYTPKATATTSVLNPNRETEQRRQQFLQLEIARELDGGNNSRRFQLAIQSHVSSLTVGTCAESEMEMDDVSQSGMTFYNNIDDIIPMPLDDDETTVTMHASLSDFCYDDNDDDDDDDDDVINSRYDYDDDDDEVEIVFTESEDDEIEIVFDDSGTIPTTKQQRSNEDDIQETLEDEKPRKALPPALLLQKSHSWMRKKLWVEQQELVSPPKQVEDTDSGSGENLDTNKSENDEKRNEMEYMEDVESARLPTAPHEKYSATTADLPRWKERIVFYCLMYIIPFTYRGAMTLPQLYFLIELVKVHDTNLYFAGVYLATLMILRYMMRSFCRQKPRIAAIGGTVAALSGYLILFVSNELEPISMRHSVLFILGSVIVGLNEIIEGLDAIVRDIFVRSAPSSTPTNRDLKNYIESIALCRDVQYHSIQLSTIICFAAGGVVYEYFDMTGMSGIGVVLLGLQLVSFLIALGAAPMFGCTNQSLSEEFRRLIGSSGPPVSNPYSVPLSSREDDSSNPSEYAKSEYLMERLERSQSFCSMVTPELATIPEVPAAESESDDDQSGKFTYFESEKNDSQQSMHQSMVSCSSGTTERDNRTSTKAMGAAANNDQGSKHHHHALDFNKMMEDDHNPPLQWVDIFLVVGGTVPPMLNGLVFGVGTVLLLEELDQNKSTIGYIYAASSLCGVVATMIPQSILDFQFLVEYNNAYGVLYLFGTTYMILLTALSLFITNIIGMLLMSFLLGLFTRSLHVLHCQWMQSNKKSYLRLKPYRQWIRAMCAILVTLLSPMFYSVMPRLPNMIGTGVCFTFTVIVWFGSTATKMTPHCDSDDEFQKVNTTADTTVPSESVNGTTIPLDLQKRITYADICSVRLESITEHSI